MKQPEFYDGGRSSFAPTSAPPTDTLIETITLLEQVIATVDARLKRPCQEVLLRLEQARQRFEAYIDLSEETDGLLGVVDHCRPELEPQAQALRQEHLTLDQQLDELQTHAGRTIKSSLAGLEAACHQTRQIVACLRDHRDKGSALALEAYMSDLGLGD